jgi:hypothetical protein
MKSLICNKGFKNKKVEFCIVLCKNNLSHINRKKSKCEFFKADINILNEKEQKNIINYFNHIQLDYGRVELLHL